jgi:hypothetical protein
VSSVIPPLAIGIAGIIANMLKFKVDVFHPEVFIKYTG